MAYKFRDVIIQFFKSIKDPLYDFIDVRLQWILIPALAWVVYFTPRADVINVFSMISLILISLSISHWIRKVMFPSIDISDLMDRIKESPMASALVIVMMLIFIMFVAWLPVSVLRPF